MSAPTSRRFLSTNSYGYPSIHNLLPCAVLSLGLSKMLKCVLFYKNKKADSFSCMDFICSLFQLYKYYLLVMDFWPLPVETKSITYELLNLQSFKIPDFVWFRKRIMETCHRAFSCSLFIPSSFFFFHFPFSSPSVFSFSFLRVPWAS